MLQKEKIKSLIFLDAGLTQVLKSHRSVQHSHHWQCKYMHEGDDLDQYVGHVDILPALGGGVDVN